MGKETNSERNLPKIIQLVSGRDSGERLAGFEFWLLLDVSPGKLLHLSVTHYLHL